MPFFHFLMRVFFSHHTACRLGGAQWNSWLATLILPAGRGGFHFCLLPS